MVPKWTAAQIKEQIRRIQKVVEEQRRANKSEHFTAVKPEEIEAKLDRANSPFIVSQGWNSTYPGGTVHYYLGIYNPDPIDVECLFAHVWVGSGNVDPTVGTFLLNVDTRFPQLTRPNWEGTPPGTQGLMLPAGDSAILGFALKVPSTVERTNYLGNSCLMKLAPFSALPYLDRGVFVFGVSGVPNGSSPVVVLPG